MKNKQQKAMILSAALMFSGASIAANVDLSGWEKDGSGTWSVQSGNNSVKQIANTRPGVFFENGNNARDTSISGEISVETSFDNDFIGFVLGYQDGEIFSDNADFWLIDWKQSDQNVGSLGDSYAGLSLSHVTDGSSDSSFWAHTPGSIDEIARANTLGSTGWVDYETYTFDIVHTASLIEVSVNGNVELSVTAAQAGVSEFADGAYGFYNYSQSSVSYAGITDAVIITPPSSVPEPSSLAIFALGVAGLCSRKLKKASLKKT